MLTNKIVFKDSSYYFEKNYKKNIVKNKALINKS